jgi:hypothetical protein
MRDWLSQLEVETGSIESGNPWKYTWEYTWDIPHAESFNRRFRDESPAFELLDCLTKKPARTKKMDGIGLEPTTSTMSTWRSSQLS